MTRRRLLPVTALAGVVALAVAAVLVVAGGGGGGSGGGGGIGGSGDRGSTGTTGSSTDPAAFDLPRLDGPGRVQLAGFRGTPVVVNLFASWCDACRLELPGFARAARQLQGKVAFVGVDSLETGDGRAMASEFDLAASGFTLAKDAGAMGSGFHDALGATGMPVTAFYDASGRLVERRIGAMPEPLLRQTLRKLYQVEV